MKKLLIIFGLLIPIFVFGQDKLDVRQLDSIKVALRANTPTLADAQARRGTYVTPEMYGAVGDGTTNDNTAIQNAINSGLPVYLTKKYHITQLVSRYNMVLKGFGSAQLISSSNQAMISDTSKNVIITDITFEGSGKASGNTLQHGILATGFCDGGRISGCLFYNLGGYGIEGHDHSTSALQGLQISDFNAMYCYGAIYFYSQSEYNSISNSFAYGCGVGFKNSAGNNNWDGGQVWKCDTLVYLGSGVNDGHCVMSNVKLNHAVNQAIYSTGVLLDYSFVNCPIYYGNITLISSTGIKFTGCEFSMSGYTLTVTSCTNTQFYLNEFKANPTVTITGTIPLWFRNFWDAGAPTGVIDQTNYLNIFQQQNFVVGGSNSDPSGLGYAHSMGVSDPSGTAGFFVNGFATSSNFNMYLANVRYWHITTGTGGTTSMGTVTAASWFLQYNSTAVLAVNSGDLSPQTAGAYNLGTATKYYGSLFVNTARIMSLTAGVAHLDASGNVSSSQVLPSDQSNSGSNEFYALQLLGATPKGYTVGAPIYGFNNPQTLTSGQVYYTAVYLPAGSTLTGVNVYMNAAGSYTSTGYNGIGLYTINISTGLLTQVATSTTSTTVWTTAQGINKIPFSSTYVATAGVYYVALLWQSSSTTTSPAIYSLPQASSIMAGYGFTSGIKLTGVLAGTVLPSTIALSTVTSANNTPFIQLY